MNATPSAFMVLACLVAAGEVLAQQPTGPAQVATPTAEPALKPTTTTEPQTISIAATQPTGDVVAAVADANTQQQPLPTPPWKYPAATASGRRPAADPLVKIDDTLTYRSASVWRTTHGDPFVQTISWRPEALAPDQPGPISLPLEDRGEKPAVVADWLFDDTTGMALPGGATSYDRATSLLNFWLSDTAYLRLDGLIRGYYFNDQRIEWSGLETSFGSEAVFRPLLAIEHNDWTISGEGEFFLNQHFGPNKLSDPDRALYLPTIEPDEFDVFQLYCQVQRGDVKVRIGRTRTPFGNFNSPMYTNALIDAPFIRTDIIGFTETGAFISYQPDWFSVDVGLINGEPDLDTNSDKGVVGRVGVNLTNTSFGVSGKNHDGISSEQFKKYNNHYGIDFTHRFGKFAVYGEFIYDEHGFHRDFANLGDPTALRKRSFYGLDVFKGNKQPVSGTGGYLGLVYRGDRLIVDGSYSLYSPEKIGIATHDETINRAVGKIDYALTDHFHVFAVGIVENQRVRVGPLNAYYPYAGILGFQVVF